MLSLLAGQQLTKIDSVLGVEARHVDEINAAANHVAGCERRPVRLTATRRAERVAIIAVITKRTLLPTYAS